MSQSSAPIHREFSDLMHELEFTYKKLEQIKSEQTKNYELIAESFQKAKLSIYEQEQAIRSQVEEEDKRLRCQLYSIMKSNNLSFEDGVAEINSLIQEFEGIMNQLKDFRTLDFSETEMKDIKERLSNIFQKKTFMNTTLSKLHFTPCRHASNILGKIQCEEKTLNSFIPNPTKKDPASCVMVQKTVLPSDENPPQEDPSDVTLCEKESDLDPRTSTPKQENGTTLNQEKKTLLHLKRKSKSLSELDETDRDNKDLQEMATDSRERPQNVSLKSLTRSQKDNISEDQALSKQEKKTGESSHKTYPFFQNKNNKRAIPAIPSSVKKCEIQTKHHLPKSELLSKGCLPSSSTPPDATQEIHVSESSDQNWNESKKTPHELPYKSETDVIQIPTSGKLVKQFGKFGTGRSELNLPYGIHATTTGLLYIVDFGNHRLQVRDATGHILQQIALRAKNYFDVAVNNQGLIALTNSTDGTVEIYNRHGRFLQIISSNWGDPRGITVNHQDKFIVADMKQGTLWVLTVDPSSGHLMKSKIVPGLNKPYLVNSNSQGLLVVSEKGFSGESCVKVLSEDWQTLKVLGRKESSGPMLFNPWGVCIDNEGGVLVANWGKPHSLVYYSPTKNADSIVTVGLRSPRGLALLQNHLLLVADSMNNCIKVFQYK